MKSLLVLLILLSSNAQATCLLNRMTCYPQTNFENIYEIETTRCAAPGGPVHKTSYFRIYNKLVNNADQPVVNREITNARHWYLEADLKVNEEQKVFLKIRDSRYLPEGEFHISTPDADYMQLLGYSCKQF